MGLGVSSRTDFYPPNTLGKCNFFFFDLFFCLSRQLYTAAADTVSPTDPCIGLTLCQTFNYAVIILFLIGKQKDGYKGNQLFLTSPLLTGFSFKKKKLIFFWFKSLFYTESISLQETGVADHTFAKSLELPSFDLHPHYSLVSGPHI